MHQNCDFTVYIAYRFVTIGMVSTLDFGEIYFVLNFKQMHMPNASIVIAGITKVASRSALKKCIYVDQHVDQLREAIGFYSQHVDKDIHC
jgi:hypothetical protein